MGCEATCFLVEKKNSFFPQLKVMVKEKVTDKTGPEWGNIYIYMQ